MHAIILCPGPSLARWHAEAWDESDVLIGVNRAAAFVPCDVFAAVDYPMIRDNGIRVRGTPDLLSRRQTIDDLGTARLSRFPNIITVESLFGFCSPNQMPWTLFTMTSAIIYAASLGAKRIDLYGCDWKGTEDYDGVEAGENRTEDRWERDEKPLYARVKAWLDEQGIELIRHEFT